MPVNSVIKSIQEKGFIEAKIDPNIDLVEEILALKQEKNAVILCA